MSEIEIQPTTEEIINIKKSKLLYALHVVVPIGSIVCSTVATILTYLQTNVNSTLNISDQNNNTTYNMSTLITHNDKILDALKVNKNAETVLLHIVQAFMVIFAFLQILYSKMMNSESHKIGNSLIKERTEKHTLLEQMSNITTSLSNPTTSRQQELIFMNMPKLNVPISPSIVSPVSDPPKTAKSDSTVYIKPYTHEPFTQEEPY